jgi:hypothetical protein
VFHHIQQVLSLDVPKHKVITDQRCPDPFFTFYLQKEEPEAGLFAAFFLCPDVSDCKTVAEITRKYHSSKVTAKRRREEE